MNALDEVGLGVALEGVELVPGRAGLGPEPMLDLRQRRTAVDPGLPHAELPQIGAVQQ